MKKQKVDILKCVEGDILADDIYNHQGVLIAKAQTKINRRLVLQLFQMGIFEVRIVLDEDHKEMNEYARFTQGYEKYLTKVQNIFCQLSSGKGLDLYELNSLAQSIIDVKGCRTRIFQYIDEMRTKDRYTYCHSLNVAFYGKVLAQWMNMSEEEIKDIVRVGILHDIGKLKISPDILNKKGKLTDEEFAIIKTHTSLGYAMLESIEDLKEEIKLGVLMHHERENGSGYPFQLVGKEIHLYAKIIAVADIYDAVISDRVYKRKSTPFEAFEILRNMVFYEMDPVIIYTFLKNIHNYYIGAAVKVNDRQVGEIVHISSRSISKPIIRVQSQFYDLSRTNEVQIQMI